MRVCDAMRYVGEAVRVMHGNVRCDVHEYALRVCAVCACCVRACASFGPWFVWGETIPHPGAILGGYDHISPLCALCRKTPIITTAPKTL
jgi:hypothetical protein